MPRVYPSLIERFLDKVVVGATPDDCWEWTGSRTAPGWHGVIVHSGGRIMAHRAAWELYVGPIPDGLKVLHHCDNAGCVNVAHLFLGTQRDNMQDAARKGRTGPQIKDFSKCKRGHDLTGANVYVHPSTGRRSCRACIAWRNAQRHRAA